MEKYYNDQKTLIKNTVDEVIFDMEFAQKIVKTDSLKSSVSSLCNIESKLKEEILNRLSKMRFGEEGYVFVNTFDGKALIFDGKLQEKPIDILKSNIPGWYGSYKKMKDTLSSDSFGHYFKYPFKMHSSNTSGYKISYVRIYRPWGWMIGSGVYYNEINKTANIERTKLREHFKKDILRLLSVIFLFIVIMLFIINRIIKRSVGQNVKAFKILPTK